MKRPLSFLIIFSVSLIFQITALAQPSFTLQNFEQGGRNHLLRYEAGMEEFITPSLTAIEDTISRLLPLFDAAARDLPFQIVLDLYFEGEVGADIEANAAIYSTGVIEGSLGEDTITDTTACHIQVYGNVITRMYAPFTIAHEMVHCFQDYYLNEVFEAGSLEASGWWVEGTAEWMATLVYPTLAHAALRDGAAEGEWIYAEQNLALTDTASANDFYAGYGTVYFWEFLAQDYDILSMLRALSTGDVSEEDYQNFLVTQLGGATSTIDEFALALAQDVLSYQPNSTQLFGLSIPVPELPYSFPVELDDFRVNLSLFYVPPIDGVTAIRITTQDFDSDSETTININYEASAYQQINDDTPVTLCLPPEGVLARFVISRGDGDAPAPFEIHFEALSEPEPDCGDIPSIPVDMGCALGSWQLTNDPIRQFAENQLGRSIATGGSPGIVIINIAEDGTINYAIDDYLLVIQDMSLESGGYMQMDAVLSGEINLSANLDGTFLVSDFDWTISFLSAMANINGFEMDMTNVVLGTADASRSLATSPAQLQCIGDQFLDWWVVFEDETYFWHFSRVE